MPVSFARSDDGPVERIFLPGVFFSCTIGRAQCIVCFARKRKAKSELVTAFLS